MRGMLLVAPFDADTAAVDRLTGRAGWGHVALVADERDDDGRLVAIDASMQRGCVQPRPLYEITRGARWCLVSLGEGLEHTYRGATARIGQPYNYRGLLGFQRPGVAATCSQLVYECLPPSLQRRVQPWRPGWVSPNCLARGLGKGSAACSV